jgi:hypothetical protein
MSFKRESKLDFDKMFLQIVHAFDQDLLKMVEVFI